MNTDTLISILALGIFFFAIIGLPMLLIIRYRRTNKKKQEAFNKLTAAKQRKELLKRDSDVTNIVTFVLPMALFITLEKSGVAWGLSLLISLGVAGIFRLIFQRIR